MTIVVKRSVDDPIVTFTFEKLPNDETIREVITQATEYLQEMGTYYAVIDIRLLQVKPEEITALFEMSGQQNIFTDPLVKPVFVSRNVSANPQTLIFADEEHALEYIRRMIAQNASDMQD